MTQGTRIALLACVLALACNSPDTALFGTPGPGPMGNAGSNTAGGGSAGSGAATSGGTSMVGGEGAAPSAGSAGTGQVPSEGGADGDPMTGDGGVDQGTGGAPPEPPQPVCGNGKLEGTEECDDNGHEGKDGCNANCEVVCSDFDDEESEAVESADRHCYNGYDSADFEGAQAACAELGGHLATISSAAENEIAASFVSQSKFIGGFEMVDVEEEMAGTYQWVTGEPFDYENWGEDQPDQNATRCNGGFSGPWCYAHCAAINGQGAWMDQRCDMEDGYVCEWEPAGD